MVQGLIAAGVGISLLPALALTNVREDIVVRSLGAERRRADRRRDARRPVSFAGRDAMLDILGETAERFELPSGAAIAA